MAELFTLPARATDSNGDTLSGAKLKFYATGTTTPQNVYSDSGLSTSLGAVVTADSGGKFAAIYLDTGLTYRGVLETSDGGTTIFDIDPINFPIDDSIWTVGRATPIAGSKMAIRWLRDDASYPLEDEAGIWPGKVVTDHGISATFGSSDGQAGSPCNGLFVLANNDGSPGDVVAGLFDAVARTNNTTVFGANIIARGEAAHSGVKYVGAEIDVVPNAGDTSISTDCIGLAINAFNLAVPGPAIMTGGVSSGTFNNGLVLGGLASTAAGVLLESSAQANSLVNTTVGTFNGVAITLGNGQSRGIRLSGTAAAHAFIYNDGSNNIRHVLGSGAWILRNNADTTSLFSIDASGNVNLENGGVYRISGTQVVSARGAAVADATGGATIDAEARTAVNTLLARLRTHGLIAT